MPSAPLNSVDGAASRSTYRDILKSTALIGGASAITLGIGFLRTKAMAVLLGPAGFGAMGMFIAIADMAKSFTDLGINASGVRQIAASAASGDTQRISRTAAVLRRTALALALVGAVVLATFSPQVARFTFGDDRYATAVALLSIVLFLRVVSDSQLALIQGLRRIRALAGIGIVASGIGLLVMVPVVFWWGEEGIVPSLILAAALTLAISSRVIARIAPAMPHVPRKEFIAESSELLRLGIAFMASALLMMTAAYAVRTFILRHEGLEAAGLYAAAWTLAGLWVGFILQALGTDFYPRLVAESTDDARGNRLVNEQTHVSLLLAGPGIVATMTFAPFLVYLFYTPSFLGSVDLLRWILMGMALRVISWPIGFIIVAKNKRLLFLSVEIAWTAANLFLSYYLLTTLGLEGAGIAFFLSYVFHALVTLLIVRRLSGFAWSVGNLRLSAVFIAGVGTVFLAFQELPSAYATAVGTVIALGLGFHSIKSVAAMSDIGFIPPRLIPLLQFFKSKTRFV